MALPSFLHEPEARILRRLPEILLAGTVPPALAALMLNEGLAGILAVALITAWWFLLLPLALCCLILCVMKAPARASARPPCS
jgi:hypothetical protein